jgi:hypothetical protein
MSLVDDRFDAPYHLFRVTKDEITLRCFRDCFLHLESNVHFIKALCFLCDLKLSHGSSKVCVSQCCEEIYQGQLAIRVQV